jgi:endoglucanase
VRRTVTTAMYPTQALVNQRGPLDLRRVAAVMLVAMLFTGVAAGAVALTPLSNIARGLTFHSSVVDRGSLVTLPPGTTASVTLLFRNSGFTAWERGDPGSQVDLAVKGDSIEFAKAGMAVGWLSENRIATATESFVSPGAVGSFTFTVRAPSTLGVYRMPVQLVVDGVTWLEDQETFVVVASDFGFHSELIGQSLHPTLRVGETSAPITVKLRNTGTRDWVRGKADQQVNLGVESGDAVKALAVGWPSADRVAIQTEFSVPPGDAATFAFRVRAPSTPGTYALRLRPVVDGVTWLEGDGVMTLITVIGVSGQAPSQPASTGAVTFTSSASVSALAVSAGGSATITAGFTSSAATTALVGVEVYTPDGLTLAFQKWFEGQSFASGEPRSFAVTWQVPTSAALGTYTVALRAFAPGWTTLLSKKDEAATLVVTAPSPAAASAAPAATAGPDGTTPTAAPAASLAAVTGGSSGSDQDAAAAANRKPTFTMSATVAPATIEPSGSVGVSASFTSASSRTVNVTVSIYAPGGTVPVHQQSFTSQSFGAGQQRSYPVTWQAPSTAALGTYRVALGVYSTNWTTEYAWSDSAATFAVAAPAPPPTPIATPVPTATPAATAIATPTVAPTATSVPLTPSFTQTTTLTPPTVTRGSPVSITTTITSATAATGIVDIEIYAPDGTTRVNQQFFDNQIFAAGQQRTYSVSWQVPAATVAGTYVVRVGVFPPGWGTRYNWFNSAATFVVTTTVATPTASALPTATPVPTPSPAPTASPVPTASPAPTAPASFSGIRVQGNQFVNATGQTVVLRGANRMGFEYSCVQGQGLIGNTPLDLASVTAMKSWGINTVRLPLNEHCWLGVEGSPTGETYRQGVQNYVNLLTANNVYVILSLHWSAAAGQSANGQQAMPNTSYSRDFWTSVANRFKSDGRVLFDLFNEPIPNNNANDNTDTAARRQWECWRDGGASGSCDANQTAGTSTTDLTASQVVGMQALVNAARATGATNVLMVGGIQWGTTIWSSATHNLLTYKPTDPLNNVAASVHIYNWTWCTNLACWNAEIAPVAAQVPVVAGEFGNDSCDGTWLETLMDWMDGRQISYTAWVWNAYNSAACGGSMKLVLDYAGTPTQYGRFYKDHLATLQ